MSRLWRKDIAAEFGVALRTVDRWLDDGTLPKPRRWHGRPFWMPADLTRAEQINLRRFTRNAIERVRRAARLKLARRRSEPAPTLNNKQLRFF